MATEPAETTIAGLLRFQATACERLGSPLYSLLLDRAASDVEAHGPSWEVLRGHEGDPGPSALALRFMGAVNRLLVADMEPALAAIYRNPKAEPARVWEEFSATLERNVEALRQTVNLPVQTNEVGRCAALLLGFLTVAAETGLPLRLLEVGASAGLNLRWDRYRYLADGFEWGPADSPVKIEFELDGGTFPALERIEVSERHGCDAAPLDPATAEGRLALLAYIWPDQAVRVERMRAALEVANEVPAPVDRESAASWAARKLTRVTPGEATILYHSIVAQYLGDEELTAFYVHVHNAAERANADAPLAWLRMEPAGEWADLHLTTWPGGEDRHLAQVGYHGTPIELL